jgi:hypothetical protein
MINLPCFITPTRQTCLVLPLNPAWCWTHRYTKYRPDS